jgi:ABC-type bacteriocin/lantibiotic exporter with double-glycine peptidase domain
MSRLSAKTRGMLLDRLGLVGAFSLIVAFVLGSAAPLDVPFVPQRKDTCAAAALAMVLQFWGQPAAEEEIARQLLEPQLHGILGSRLQAFARDAGFTAIAYEGDAGQLREFVGKGRPLIVAWKVGADRFHNVVVIGFDDDRHEVLVNDPAEGARRGVTEREFEARWARAGHWTLLVLPQPKP